MKSFVDLLEEHKKQNNFSLSDYIIVVQNKNSFHKIKELLTNYYNGKTIILPKILLLDSFADEFERQSHLEIFFEILELLFSNNIQKDLHSAINLANNILETLNIISQHTKSLEDMPFSKNYQNDNLTEIWNIIETIWEKHYSCNNKEFLAIKNLQKFILKSKKFIFFIDSFPNYQNTYIDEFRNFLIENKNSCIFSSNFEINNIECYFEEFDSSTEESSGIAQIIKNNSDKDIAIVSDNKEVLSKIYGELGALNIRSKYIFLDNNEIVELIESSFNFLKDSSIINIINILNSNLIRNSKFSEYKNKIKDIVKEIFLTKTEIIDNRLLIKNNLYLEDIRLIVEQKKLAIESWFNKVVFEPKKFDKRMVFFDFLNIHFSYIRIILDEAKIDTQQINKFKSFVYEALQDKKYFQDIDMEQNTYFKILKILIQNSKQFCSNSSKNIGEIYLLDSKNALNFKYDIAILPSMNENDWFCNNISNNIVIPLEKTKLSKEFDFFSYITKNHKTYIFRIDNNFSLKHRFLDKIIKRPVAIDKKENDYKIQQTASAFSSITPVDCRPKKLSATNIQMLIDDPYSFYCKKILKLTPIINNKSLDFGIWSHYILDKYFSEKLYIKENFLNSFIETFSSTPVLHTFSIRLLPFLKQTKDNINKKNIEKIITEEKISMYLDIENRKYNIYAIVDRIDFYKGNDVSLIDYKTSILPSKNDLKNCSSIQIPIEAKIFQNLYQNKNISLIAIRIKNKLNYVEQVELFFDNNLKNNVDFKIFEILKKYNDPNYYFSSTLENKNRYGSYEQIQRFT